MDAAGSSHFLAAALQNQVSRGSDTDAGREGKLKTTATLKSSSRGGNEIGALRRSPATADCSQKEAHSVLLRQRQERCNGMGSSESV